MFRWQSEFKEVLGRKQLNSVKLMMWFFVGSDAQVVVWV